MHRAAGVVLRCTTHASGARTVRLAGRLRQIAEPIKNQQPVVQRSLHVLAPAASSSAGAAAASESRPAGSGEEQSARPQPQRAFRQHPERVQRQVDGLASKLAAAAQQAAARTSIDPLKKAIAAVVKAEEEFLAREGPPAPAPEPGRRPQPSISLPGVAAAAVRALLAVGDLRAAETVVTGLREAGRPRPRAALVTLLSRLVSACETERWAALAAAEGLAPSGDPRGRALAAVLAIGRCTTGDVAGALAGLAPPPGRRDERPRVLFRALAALARQRHATLGPASAAALGPAAPSSAAALGAVLDAAAALPGFPSALVGLVEWLAGPGLRGAPAPCLEDLVAAAAARPTWRPALPLLRRAAVREAAAAGRLDAAERFAAAAAAALDADAAPAPAPAWSRADPRLLHFEGLLDVAAGKLRAGRTSEAAEGYAELAGRLPSRRALVALAAAAPDFVRHGAASAVLPAIARLAARPEAPPSAGLPPPLRAAAEQLARRAGQGMAPGGLRYVATRDQVGLAVFASRWARALLASNESADVALVPKLAAAAAPLSNARGRRALQHAEWAAGALLDPRAMTAAVASARAFLDGLDPAATSDEAAAREAAWRGRARLPSGVRGLLAALLAARPRRAADVAAVLDAPGARALLGPRAWHAWRARALLEAGPAAEGGGGGADLLPAFRELHAAERAGQEGARGGGAELAAAYERLVAESLGREAYGAAALLVRRALAQGLSLPRATFHAMRDAAAARGSLSAARHWASCAHGSGRPQRRPSAPEAP